MERSVVKLKLASVTLAGVALVMMIILGPVSSEATATQDAATATLFKTKCAICHGADGSGNTTTGKELKIKSLSSPEVQKMTDDQLLQLIMKGKDKIPPFEKSLGADK
jgi:mono/diheme cytochrome c family protein